MWMMGRTFTLCGSPVHLGADYTLAANCPGHEKLLETA